MKTLSVCMLLGSLASLLIATGIVTAAAAAGTTATAGDPVNGKRVFFADGCVYCHGTTGAGGGPAGPRLAPNPLPLEGVTAKVRTPSGRMPVYSPAVLRDAEIADIVAYLQSIPKGTDAKDIPLLNR
jgi:mono/diheme cytochrome c family protein